MSDAFGFARGFVFRAQASRMSFASNSSSSRINRWSFTNRPSAPSRGPKRGRKCYVTPAFWGNPKRQARGAKSELVPKKGNKIRNGCLTLAFLEAQKRAKMRRHPCILGGPQKRGAKSKVATSPLPSRGPKRGRKCYVTPAFSGVPKKGEQNQKWLWLPHPCFLGGPKEGRNATSPGVLGGPQQRGTKSELAASPII